MTNIESVGQKIVPLKLMIVLAMQTSLKRWYEGHRVCLRLDTKTFEISLM